ncbi:MAG: AAA family ATPase [Candidatus Fonsibacter ubiquis]|jgi:DNA polymerase III delta prime subunit
MQANREQFLWVEKYRPRTIRDCILPDNLKNTFQEFVDQDNIPNMLLSGTAGTGKTTIARALCEELGCDYIIINGSEESGIDVLRTKIKDFASTVSLAGKVKVVILDEADYLNPNSTQPALRGFIEEFSKNCRFIFTCNFANRIIAPLHSRTTVIDFRLTKQDRPQMAAKFFKRVVDILNQENITHNPKVVAEIVNKYFPDYRRVLNELQRYSASGTIDEGILVNISDANLKELVSALREKDFKKMRTWVVNNLDNDPNVLFRKLYDTLLTEVVQVPQLVLLLADYQYKAAFVADAEINLVACLTEIMAACEMKS